MKAIIELSREEVQEMIPYAIVCETQQRAVWETGRRKRAWNAMFSDSEKASARRLFRKAYLWTLVKGVPDKVRMTPATMALWQKLGDFCASIG